MLDSYNMINQYSNFGWEMCLYLMFDDVLNVIISNKFINITMEILTSAFETLFNNFK